MKSRIGKTLSITLVAVIAGLCAYLAHPTNAEPLETAVMSWKSAASVTAASGDLTVSERQLAAVKAMIAAGASNDEQMVVYPISQSSLTAANIVKFRCLGHTDEDDVDFNVYVGNKGRNSDCDLTLLCTLEFVVGTQQSYRIRTGTSPWLYCHQVVVTDGDTGLSAVSSSADDDRIAEVTLDLQGADTLVIVPTTVDNSAAQLLVRFL